MADIKDQLIKDSYNYVLQSDLSTGVVYRIGGTVPVNPIFSSGLTVNNDFIYSNGTEQPGYTLLTDGTGYAYWGPVSGASPSSGVTSITVGNGLSASSSTGAVTIVFTGSTSASGDYLPLSGGTVTGNTIFQSGLTATTISATTYYNLPVSAVTNGTGISASTSNGTVTVTNTAPDQTVTISGGTNIQIAGSYPNFGVNYTGQTSFPYLPLSGGTVTGGTIFTSGLTANTISATTYYNLPTDVFVTGGTYTSGNAIFTNNTGGTFTVTGFAIGGGGGQLFYLNLSQSQGSNRLLSTTGSTASQQTTGVTINNGVTGSIASFQSQPLNITLLPGGIWSFYLHSYKQNTNASFDIFVEVYKRTSGGTQTLLFSTDPTPVTTNSPNPSMQLSDSYFSGTTLLVSDSIVATVRATNTGNQSHTITLVTEGSTHYSYVVSTIPTQQGITCDTLSGCTIIQTIQTDLTNKLDKSGGTISGGLVVNSGLTANTISATTYYNLPVSGLTGGSNIGVSGLNGNYTISFTGTSGTSGTSGQNGSSGSSGVSGTSGTSGVSGINGTSGTSGPAGSSGSSGETGASGSSGSSGTSSGGSSVTLFASNSIQIVQDGNPYIGNSSFGWSYSQWNFQTPSPAELAPINTNVGVPIIRDLVRFDYIKICGIASIDNKDIEALLEYNIYLFNCNDLTLALLGGGQQLFTTDLICFCHSILINDPIFTCDNFLVVEFTCTPGRNPGTICNISYSLYVPNLGNTGCSGTGGGAGS